jgi:hypothetical protein
MFPTETALEWWQRSERSRRRCHDDNDDEEPPRDAVGAAWAFAQPRLEPGRHATTTTVNGTGVSFIDAALLQCIHNQQTTRVIPRVVHRRSPPVLEILGDHGSGKTWALLALAARFVVATRQSRFSCNDHGANENTRHDDDDQDFDLDDEERSCGTTDTPPPPIPQVILLDSNYGVHVLKLAHAVRTLLLQGYPSNCENDTESMTANDDPPSCSSMSDLLEYDLNECLSRIHIVTSDDLAGWVPILESIREHMERTVHFSGPTLLLWDGFLSEPHLLQTEAIKREVVRQLERLLAECSQSLAMAVVSTTTRATSLGAAAARPHGNGLTDWEKLVTRRIHLQRIIDHHTSATTGATADESQHEQETHVATILDSTQQTTIPFVISKAGLPT